MAVIVGQGISVSPVADAELSHESTSTVQNKVVTDAIASEYSTSKTYSVGDVCTHDGKLYECIVDIPTAEGWTLSHWKVSNLGDNVSNLNRQLNDVDGEVTDTQGMLATVETTATASKSYAVGDLLVYNGKLYKVTSAIATGATIIVGSNVTQTTVESQIAAGGKTWKKFRDVTITLDKPTTNVTYVEGTDGITQISFNVDDDGNSFEFTDIKILAILKDITGAGMFVVYSGTIQQNIAIITFRGSGTQGQARVYEAESVLIDGVRFYSGIYATQYSTIINHLAPNQIVNNQAFGGNYNKFLTGFVSTNQLFNKVNMITMFFNDATVEGRVIFFGK